MRIDEVDLKVIHENFDDEMIEKLDRENVQKIFNYLINNGIYYAMDIFESSLNLFLLPLEEFVNKFENLKKELGPDFAEKLAKDMSLLEIMY